MYDPGKRCWYLNWRIRLAGLICQQAHIRPMRSGARAYWLESAATCRCCGCWCRHHPAIWGW